MKRYQTYKDSGVEWIGEVPEGWEVIRMRYVFNFLSGTGFPNLYQGKTEGNYPFYKVSDINRNGIDVSLANNYVTRANVVENGWTIIPEKSILLAKIGEALKKNHRKINASECLIDNNMLALIKKNNYYDISYLYYLMLLIDMVWFINPGAVPSIDLNKLRDFFVAIPEKAEQTAVAAYLDRKTVQIDNLISKKQKLIELLKEERAAIINQAVTKGLNPDVPMKDSGIEWLGEIPAHWEIKRLKYIARLKYGLGQPPKQVYDGLPLIRATNIERGIIIAKDLIYVDPEDIPYDRDPILRKNDIIVVRSGAYTGDSSIIPEKYHGSIAGYDMVVRGQAINPLFLSYAFLSTYVLIGQLYLHRLRAAQPHLNIEELGSILIAFAGKEKEQALIAKSLRLKCSKIDQTISKIQKQIHRLKEFRTTLISEVVTGKIDVRDEGSK